MFDKKIKNVKLREYKRDDENRVIINMTVKDDSDFLSPFSQSDTPVISPAVAEFIENSCELISSKELLFLNIHSNCIDDDEKKQYVKAIREYYSEKSVVNAKELKRNNVIVFLLTIAGILVLSLAIALQYLTDYQVWSEVIDIVAWVLLWEAVDISAFENRSLRNKYRRYQAFLNMKIVFIDID